MQEFKWNVIAKLPGEDFKITLSLRNEINRIVNQ